LIAQTDRRLKRITHVACARCSLIRQWPLPTESDLATYYRDVYRSDYQKTVEPTQNHVKKRQNEAAPRLAHLSPLLEPGSTIIDFGCGSGEFIAACNAAGFVGKGFEPGAGYARYARDVQKLHVENKGWQDYTADAPADAVTSFHVFEHLVDPVAAIRKAQSWIRPDGLIYIEVPDTRYFIELKGFGCLHMAHTLAYTDFTLEYAGAVCGLEVVKRDIPGECALIFRSGTPRDLAEIEADARAQSASWTRDMVHRRFWAYTFGKLRGAKA
jgi:2-polyprenyl-3-methyl-5-hydroxy-6-metoxy-1,4-benzoquinol methylase